MHRFAIHHGAIHIDAFGVQAKSYNTFAIQVAQGVCYWKSVSGAPWDA